MTDEFFVDVDAGGEEPSFVTDLNDVDQRDMDDTELRQIIVDYERETDDHGYRRMAKKGELNEYVAIKTRSVREYATRLMDRGEIPGHAWRRAIRVCVLNREED